MLDVASVMGDSTKAAMNAQTVLDARDTVTQAVSDAKAAMMRATDARTEAEAIADGTAGKVEVLAAIETAIMTAEAELATVTAISTGLNADRTGNTEGQKLTMAVEAVTGGANADPQGTPASVAEGVATAVAGALIPMAAPNPDGADDTARAGDGTARRVEHYATANARNNATPPAVAERTFHGDNGLGMTWVQIVGEDNVMTFRRSDPTDSNLIKQVQAKSVAGMTTAFFSFPDGGGPTPDSSLSDGSTYVSASYMGVPGSVFCGGNDCKVESEDDALVLIGSWYFFPTSTTASYILNPDVAMRSTTLYVTETDYASFGHWLAVADGTGTLAAGTVTVHTYAVPAGNIANLELGAGTDNVKSAVYTGDAAGMSVHNTFGSDGQQTGIHSGAFTADVSLTATFGASPMLKGMVNNFRSESDMNTDSGWSVELKETALAATAANFDTLGVAKGSGQAGDWTAQGYGPAQTIVVGGANVNHRPTGFFGNFEAHFTDGHASGAYVTRK